MNAYIDNLNATGSGQSVYHLAIGLVASDQIIRSSSPKYEDYLYVNFIMAHVGSAYCY